MQTSFYPCARREGVVVQNVSDETLVYDSERQQANLLNPTATLVWKFADGTRSVSEIARLMSEKVNAPVDPRVVWYALEQLSNKNLLQTRAPIPNEYAHMTRRAFLANAGLVGAAVVIPVVVSMLAPSPAQAQSGCGSIEDSCDFDSDCCKPLCCIGGFCTLACD